MFIEGAISDELINELRQSSSEQEGAVLNFQGKVRADAIDGKNVARIEFTAQKKIAEQVAVDLIEESIRKFGILSAEIKHSLGNVAVGETCFFVLVKTKHRTEGYLALPFLVDGIKANCPIFGKEIFIEGDYKWKKNS